MPLKTRRRNLRAERILSSVEVPAQPSGRSALFVLVGLPGVGKSTIAARLRESTGAVVLESDRCRALLFGAPVFSQRESGILFRAIVAAAKQLLRRGRAVIIDATNLSEKDRQPFYDLAEEMDTPLYILALDAPRPVVEGRLAGRLDQAGGCSYADIAVYHRMRGRVEAISREHWRIDTSDQASVRTALTSIVDAYREGGGSAGKQAAKGESAT